MGNEGLGKTGLCQLVTTDMQGCACTRKTLDHGVETKYRVLAD